MAIDTKLFCNYDFDVYVGEWGSGKNKPYSDFNGRKEKLNYKSTEYDTYKNK